MPEILDDFPESRVKSGKERHGCVSIWLVLMLIGNSLASVVNLLIGNLELQNSSGLSTVLLWGLGVIGILNVIFVVKLYQWKKIGFYGFLITTVLSILICIGIGVIPLQAIIGLAGIAIWYRILGLESRLGGGGWRNYE